MPRSRSSARASARITIAPLASEDGVEFVAAVQVSKKLHGAWVTPPLTIAAFETRIAQLREGGGYAFALRRKDSGALVGCVEITGVVRGVFLSAYLGYYAFAPHTGQGLMREGLAQVVCHAFTRLGLHRLEANIQPNNAASIALVRACGFALEGYSPRYLKIRGRWRDHERWAIVAG